MWHAAAGKPHQPAAQAWHHDPACSPVDAPEEEGPGGQQGGQQYGGEADVYNGHRLVAQVVVVGLRSRGVRKQAPSENSAVLVVGLVARQCLQ